MPAVSGGGLARRAAVGLTARGNTSRFCLFFTSTAILSGEHQRALCVGFVFERWRSSARPRVVPKERTLLATGKMHVKALV